MSPQQDLTLQTLDRRLDQMIRVMEKGFDTLADLQRETNERINQTNLRLDQTNLRLDQTNERIDQTNLRLDRLEGRFDNLISTAGGQNARHREDIDELKTRVSALERKVG